MDIYNRWRTQRRIYLMSFFIFLLACASTLTQVIFAEGSDSNPPESSSVTTTTNTSSSSSTTSSTSSSSSSSTTSSSSSTTSSTSSSTSSSETTEAEPPTNTEPPIAYFDVPLHEDLQAHIFELCRHYKVDPVIIVAMIWRESCFDYTTVGDGGDSLGLMQLQPKWFKVRMDELGIYNLMDPYQNVLLGIDYVAELSATGNPIEWILMAYNGGAKYATHMLENGIVSQYAQDILMYSLELRGEIG